MLCNRAAAVFDAVLDGCEAVGPLRMTADVAAEPAALYHCALELADSPDPASRSTRRPSRVAQSVTLSPGR
jgi:hypothetical protein